MKNGTLASASVIKECFRDSCEVSPFILYFNQKKIRENTRRKYADAKINKSTGEGFHERSFNALMDYNEYRLADVAAFRLLELKNRSRGFLIQPTILSENLGMIGEPDIIFLSRSSANILELKDKNYSGDLFFDRIQSETYTAIFESPDSKIIRRSGAEPLPIKKAYKKKINGYLLYRNGNMLKVREKNGELIKSKASGFLRKIKDFESISDLPEPSRCNPDCVNIDYCISRLMSHENTPTSPGRTEIKSVAYGARA